MNMEFGKRRELLITMHETPGVGWQSIRKAAECGEWHAFERFTPEAWVTSAGLKLDQARALSNAFSSVDVKARDERMKELGIKVITRLDEGYPELLMESPQPPWVLYAIGKDTLLKRPSIAIVGSRGPTTYGRRTASELARKLSERGLTVVSGMARGIDALAHEGALQGSGSTIAVLGTPVDIIYPADNRQLYAEIAKNGLILSEVPIGTPFHPGLFPLRNRIIAALSLGTVVVEAAERSGSLITADQALEMSRDVFAVPGPISSPKSAGTNGLIRQGAKLVSSYEDIIEEYSGLPIYNQAVSLSSGQAESSPGNLELELSANEAIIYRLLSDEPRTVDQLHELSSFPFGLLHSVLINLTLKRKIEQHSGSIYSVM
ncbi:DNA-processing protein DprA [Paenibacillus sp. OV219]|uniref:DNA-processing protein DprA n=1 Tax=Paenibacillus sp. OV219 TaxID=1884377 RepID=UPI0008B5877D|nr:DNA-processing protein DprA [Paenibacillus sp. OV219]SEN31303.1 DNA processing protein [Paenibacillus sp. OV219]